MRREPRPTANTNTCPVWKAYKIKAPSSLNLFAFVGFRRKALCTPAAENDIHCDSSYRGLWHSFEFLQVSYNSEPSLCSGLFKRRIAAPRGCLQTGGGKLWEGDVESNAHSHIGPRLSHQWGGGDRDVNSYYLIASCSHLIINQDDLLHTLLSL